MSGPWSGRRILLVIGLGILGLVLAAGAVLLKLAQLSYESLKATRAQNERAVVRDLRALLAARRTDSPLPSEAVEASGYKRRLHVGDTAGRFTYVAVPLDPLASGRSSFCADASGLLRFSLEGEEPELVDGACPASWLVLSDDVPAPSW
jgi:hypothetical protein